MDDREFDKFLAEGKKESDKFFSSVHLNTLRKTLLFKITQPTYSKTAVPRIFRTSLIKAGIIAACVIVIGCVYFGLSENVKKQDITESPIAEQTVTFGDVDRDYKIGFYPITLPRVTEPNLMTILWKLDKGGSAEMVYSSLFEKCDQPYPISIISFPGELNSKILLISSGCTKQSYIHYRLVEFNEGDLITLWSQDFVPNGKLGIQDGVVVEQRHSALPNSNMDKNSNSRAIGTQVSYIIPYITDQNGCIVLPVEVLKLHVGDQILLVGDDEILLQVNTDNGIVKSINEESKGAGEKQIHIFQAGSVGNDILRLHVNESQNDIALSLIITD